MKIRAVSVLAALMGGCAPAISHPPPGMPLDEEHMPESDERAVTRVHHGNLPPI